ncbi:aldo/keto reductase [Alkalihalobacillus trypoxylicola]|uniref:Oxidoreductase n=1 Tax=Alkalihalobacillus trypoxylicola TaxID=519424 RepID=A0A162EDB6_9BACI|nr:aldo/keto reductase [Alkalihalobacillus trypoxylicola]KYG32322.1 oxidoreductase [Alkalihalobacillus trypoxylicola]
MELRRLGKSDLKVSSIGLGCMSLGSNEQEALTILDAAISRGINYLDTADLYDQGLNEQFIGKALKGKREQIVLATKVGNRFAPGEKGWTWDPSKEHIMSAVKESLRRLQTDYIDLYQLHGGTIDDPIDETIEAFERLKEEGIIREYGISSIRPNVIHEYAKRSSIVSVMMQFSLLDRRPEEIFPFLDEHHISVVARGPVGKGILTEKEYELLAEKIKTDGYLNYSSEDIRELKVTLNELKQHHKTNELALNYCLSYPTVASVVTGASSMNQLIENIEASQVMLSPTITEKLKDITKQERYESHRY